jgi:hypothetical protein
MSNLCITDAVAKRAPAPEGVDPATVAGAASLEKIQEEDYEEWDVSLPTTLHW